ncbi:MAG: ABC transporter permease subunit [Actinomycetales bacterium]|nr:ABC transporter permease subunit [Actinomycetales bacterium]
MDWLVKNWELVIGLSWVHMGLSIFPIIGGLVISLPLGWVAFRYRGVGRFLVPASGLLYTIPSLPLFIALPVVLGTSILDPANLVMGLTIYAIALLVRQIVDALGSVSQDVRQASVAMGYSPWQRFWRVDLPLAGPVLLSGLRVVAVSTVSLVSIGSVIGVTSLGYLFLNGFKRGIPAEVLTGVLATVIIAFLFDGTLVLIGRYVMPWTRKVTS